MTSLTGDYRSPESRDVISSHVTAYSCERQRCKKWNVQCTRVFELLPPLPGYFRSNDVTSVSLPVTSNHWRHFLSRDCFLLRATALRKWNVQCTWVFAHLQPLPGYFQSNYVTSGLLPVTWGHVTSFPATWLPLPAIYCFLEIEMYRIWKFLAFNRHFQETSGQMASLLGLFWSPEVKWRHFLSRDCLVPRATAL